jgi:hypothetical protein
MFSTATVILNRRIIELYYRLPDSEGTAPTYGVEGIRFDSALPPLANLNPLKSDPYREA